MKKTTKMAMLTLLTSATLMGMSNVKATGTTGSGAETGAGTTSRTTTGSESESGTTTLTWTDGSSVKLTISKEGTYPVVSYNMKATGISSFTSGHNYYYCITEKKEAPKFEYNTSGSIKNWQELGGSAKAPFQGSGIYIGDKLQLSSDIYFWIVEEQMNMATSKWENKFIVNGIKIEKPQTNNLGLRIKFYANDKSTTVFLSEPYDYKDKENVNFNIKIGRVTDNNILKSIKNEENGCLSKLLNYSKNQNALYTAKIPLGESAEITSKFNLIDNAYYFVYVERDTQNGKYAAVEDVSLFQGHILNNGDKVMLEYLDANFKWNLDDNGNTGNNGGGTTTTPTPNPTKKPDDNTTMKNKLPQTGVAVTMGVITGIAAISGAVFYVKSKKYKM